ncbi:magnesium-protoporphyrin IX monomethyl ester (oxidative) cyclase [Salvia divinorum]|uniref:Magnesium-protoporphyrin IX monomethyl ester (Oxidative) cyclase n=1 Tax=Salvia divinorum TaxID=28513 RepID=A0ABD1FH24_SALDI
MVSFSKRSSAAGLRKLTLWLQGRSPPFRVSEQRYITIYHHLKENPEYQCYPIFNYFENWCQDENCHGEAVVLLLLPLSLCDYVP